MMYLLDLLGTLAFAITGAFKAKTRKLNLFGVVFLGIITAIGGGTMRDIIIGRTPLFYLFDPLYLLIAIIGSIATFATPLFFHRTYSLFRLLDSIGLAAFLIIGVSITQQHLFPGLVSPTFPSFLACVFLGMVTGFGGGVVRDAIVADTPFSFREGSNYALAAFVGSCLFYTLCFLNAAMAASVSMATTLVLREVVSPFGVYRKVWKNHKKTTQ